MKLCVFLKNHVSSKDGLYCLCDMDNNDSDPESREGEEVQEVDNNTPVKRKGKKRIHDGHCSASSNSKKAKKKGDADPDVYNDISTCVSSVIQVAHELASDNKEKKEKENDPHYIWATLLARNLEGIHCKPRDLKVKMVVVAIELLEANHRLMTLFLQISLSADVHCGLRF